jgi:hypothetical protein
MTTNTTINSAANPDLVNKIASDAMALASQEATVLALAPEIQLPSDTNVELLGGIMDPFEGPITTAEVRELTGIDEEHISKITDMGKALLTILERATVSIGNQPADKDLLDSMYAGDRELLLLTIRKVTFGNEVKLGPAKCPKCDFEQVFVVNLDNDVPLKKLEGDREFIVNCKVGKVKVALPTGRAQKALVASNNRTSAELDTVLLQNCVVSINDMPVVDAQVVRALSIKDRRDILKELVLRNPGPQLDEVKINCQSCDQEVSLPLTLADLFQ